MCLKSVSILVVSSSKLEYFFCTSVYNSLHKGSCNFSIQTESSFPSGKKNGYWSFNLDKSLIEINNLKRFTDAMLHRGPDASGYELFENSTLGLGQRRLSILDLSDSGKQPMTYANERYWIVYNGEIFNFKIFNLFCTVVWRLNLSNRSFLPGIFCELVPIIINFKINTETPLEI